MKDTVGFGPPVAVGRHQSVHSGFTGATSVYRAASHEDGLMFRGLRRASSLRRNAGYPLLFCCNGCHAHVCAGPPAFSTSPSGDMLIVRWTLLY